MQNIIDLFSPFNQLFTKDSNILLIVLLILLIILFLMSILYKINLKQKPNFVHIIGSISETILSFALNFFNIILILIVLTLSIKFYEAYKTYQHYLDKFAEKQRLELSLKNLKTQRKIARVSINPLEVEQDHLIEVKIDYFSTPILKNKEEHTGFDRFIMKSEPIYIDFMVLNFEYSLLENGENVNVVFPARLFSSSIAPENGIPLLQNQSSVPKWFEIHESNLIHVNSQEYQDSIKLLMLCATNQKEATQRGIRSYYGQSFKLDNEKNSIYDFYTVGSGGIMIKIIQ